MNLRSLQENVTEATQALDNVAEFIQAKTGDSSVFSTVRPINYGDILSRIDFTGDTTTFAQITVYKTQSKSPATPVGGTVDLILGVVEAPEGWSFKPSGTKDIWASTAIWYDGTNQSEWSTPFMVTGIDGTPGEPGEQGAPGISYRTIQVYTTTDSIETVPDRPVGGYWNMKTNEVSVPVSNNVRWYLNANDERNPKKFTWITSNTFGENGDPISDWSLPLRITGEDGKNGADGRVIEFIYRLVPNYESFTQLRNFLNIKENNLPSINEPDYVPEVNDNLNIDTVWTDSPIGISIDHQIEVVCSRIRKNVESPWEPWSQCAIWSKWGKDGMDGDGVEYIYLVTPAEINGIPTTSGHVRDTMVPGYDINDSRYQQDEFCFNDEWGFVGYDWTDEPRDVGPGEPMEWVMVRKFRDNKWQPFSEPALWATYSESGVSYITSFVFKRGSIDNPPTRPEGGDYTDPKPSDKTWSDTVPSENSNLPVWMSTRVFCSTSEYSDDDWSEPKMLADTPDFQVEYSADPNVTGDKITPYTGDEASWRASQPFVWGDDSEITDPIWMITSTRHGGKWSDWTLSRIKGEKGDKGDAGTSVNIQHKVKTKQELLNEWADYLAGGAFFTSTAGLVGGEGVYVEEEGLLYIYSGGYYPGEDTNFDLYWTSIHVKGEPGDSAYLYIRFTDGTDSSATLYENTPKKYIGVKYSTEKITDPAILNAYDTYMWSLWKGEDGWGREQVFLLTHKDTLFDPDSKHLDLPSNNDKTVPEYYPTHSYGTSAYPVDKWSDTPLTPTADYPFCWVATRKGQGNLFEDWTGPDGKCALYSRYSYDGADSIRVDLSNDLAIIPMEDGKIDPDFKDEVKTTVRVFVGDEQIPESDFTVAGHGVSIVGDEVKLLLSELTVDTKEIPLTVSLKDSTYQTTINWHILQTDVAYELVPDTFSIRRYVIGEKAGYLEKDNLGVDIWKWSDNKWIASNVPVFAKVTFINGSVTILSTEDGSVDVAKNGHTNINLAGLKDVSEIKIYVVQANASGTYLSNGDILSFETITVVSDGEPGNDGITTFKSTVFKRSNTPITTAPSGGNINSPYPNPLNGWTDGIPTGKEILWASTATFSTDPTLCKDWSVPAQMTDTADIEIIYSSRIFKNSTEALATIPAGFSKNGADNIDPTWLTNAKNNGWNDDGDETSIWMATSKMHDNVWGSWNVSRIKGESAGRTVFVFTIAESDTTNVGRPTGGSLNISSNVVTGISPTNTAYTWSMNTPSKTETRKYIWQSNATFDGDGNLVGDWSEPICITGAAGRDGADGTNIEFIYRLLPNKESLAALKTALAQKALPNTQTGEVPKSGNDGISSKDWTDEPEGISEDFKVEVMCSRKAKMTDGKFSGWEEWSIPSYWSMWGEEGKDGPGLEYIFCISAQDANVSLMWETLKAYSNYSQYQEDDFYPQKYDASSDWTDEPSDVSKDKPYEYVSTRKKIDGKWEAYSMPKLWAKYAEDGASFVTSYVFKRYKPTTSNPVPDTPTGGEWNAAPSGWSDTIPSTGDGPVWMSYRMFKIGDVSYDQTWSTPIIMIDTNDFEVIYGTKEASTETTNMPMPIDIKNREGYAANGWYDEPQTGVDFYWMATATCDNGKWSNWTITKIKGEDGQQGPQGPKGDPGKSVSIKGNFLTEDALRTAWNEWCKGNASTSGFVGGNLTTGDGYLIQDTGDLWVYDGDGEEFNDAWLNVGKIQGEPGKSMYITIRYSNNADGNPMLDEGKYGKYIGIAITDHELTVDEKNNYETYKPWQKWSGDDGWGWEQVFKATETNVAPYINSSDANKSESELITEHGLSDKPIDVNDSDCQYIWYWTRKTNGSWKGSSESDNKIYAALYTRWAKDGEQGPVGPQGPQGNPGKDGQDGIDGNGIVNITKQFAVNNDPKNYPIDNWTEDMPSTSSENRYLWCKETTTYTKSDPITIHYIIAVHGEPGANGTGNDAPIVYPAGIWDEEKTYTVTPEKVPYVFYVGDEDNDEGYYIAKTVSETTTAELGVPPWEDDFWSPIDSFEAIYADIGLFNQALVGKWVFHGDYMFSQDGVGYIAGLDTKQTSYKVFSDPATAITEWISGQYTSSNEVSWFKPNFLVNAKTGDFYGSRGSLNGITISNGDIILDSDSFRLMKDKETKVSIYNADIQLGNSTWTPVLQSGEINDKMSNGMKINNAGDEWDYQLSLYGRTEFLGSNSLLKFNKFISEIPTTYSEGNNNVIWANGRTVTAKLLFGEKTLHTLTTTSSPTSKIELDLTPFNEYVNLRSNPGVYHVMLLVTGTVKFVDSSVSGDIIVVENDYIFDWEYDVNPETIVSTNGLYTISTNGYCWVGDHLETIIGDYGLKIDGSGIRYTKDAGESWVNLI